MSKSRWGGFRKGRRRYSNWWDELRTPDAASESVAAPASPTEFDYTTAQGIWNLNSTMQFKKGNAGSGGGGSPSYNTGFSPSLDTVSGQLDGWRQRTVDISAYAGATVRLVFNYTNGPGDTFTGDIQLDLINLDGNSYSFENVGHSFETSGSGETTYAGVSWTALTTGTTAAKWNVDTGGTPSGNTGRIDAADGSYYVYAETSSPATVTGYNFWLRSPQITLGSSPTLSYYETRLGASIGTLNVHLDVIA
jgi:hypothetical protein